jgi:predicted AAA+ superfamily ATPase
MEEAKIMEILTDWNFWGNLKEKLKPRELYVSRLKEISGGSTATVLLGVRRAGKSSLAHLFIQKMIEQGQITLADSLVVNLEDPRFPATLQTSDLMQIYEVYLRKLNPSNPIVLLDEVQNVVGWEKFVRYLIESRKTRVLVTGSSSKLLGREISTVLSGRHVDLEVFPLSFKEFLEFRGLHAETEVEAVKNRIEIMRGLEEYLRWGGFPEVVLSESEARKKELLAGYFSDIILKDVVKRFGVREIEKLESLAGLYLSNISTLQSFNRLRETVGLSLDTVERFSRYLQLAGMFFFVKKFEFSVRKQLRSVRKVYVIDPGFFHVKGFKVSENYGKILENIVAIELFRKASLTVPSLEIYYWRDYQGREVDFVVKEGERVKQLIQCCYEVEDKNVKRREITALLKASREVACNNLLIVTWNYEGEEETNGTKVRFVPLWKWLMLNGS